MVNEYLESNKIKESSKISVSELSNGQPMEPASVNLHLNNTTQSQVLPSVSAIPSAVSDPLYNPCHDLCVNKSLFDCENCPVVHPELSPPAAADPPAAPDRLMSNTVTLQDSFGVKVKGKLVGFKKLRQLLAPAHPYFEDKQAYIVKFAAWKLKVEVEDPAADRFLYPVVKGDRRNPYRLYRNARAHTGRLLSQIERCVKENNLDDARICETVRTVPADLSRSLSELANGKGLKLMWVWNKQFYDRLPGVLGVDGYMGMTANLHIWKTEEPTLPHYHFHDLNFNYTTDVLPEKMRKDQQIERSGQFPVKFTKFWGKGFLKEYTDKDGNIKHGYVPYSDTEMIKVKRLWTGIVFKGCKRNKIECKYELESGKIINFEDIASVDELADDELLDVFVSYIFVDDHTRLASRLNYQRRHWIEDYTLYTIKYPDCETPPAWLESYNNKARCFGWWLSLALLGGLETDSPKLDYETGEELESIGDCTCFAGLDLWSRENYKGDIIDAPLVNDDLDWLRSVYETGFDGGG